LKAGVLALKRSSREAIGLMASRDAGPIKVLVVPGVFDCNRGDQALLWEAFDAVRAVWPDAELAVVAEVWDDPRDIQTWQTRSLGVRILPKILPNPRRAARSDEREIIDKGFSLWRMCARAAMDFVGKGLLLMAPRNRWWARWILGPEHFRTYCFLRDSAAVVVKGGGFAYGYRGLRWAYYLWFGLFTLRLAQRCGIPVIVLPNSFGPFETRWSRWWARRVFRECRLLTVREPESWAVLQRLIPGKALTFPDMAFALKAASAEEGRANLRRHGVPVGEKPCVGVSMRPYRFPGERAPEAKYRTYVEAFAALLKHLVARGFTPVLFAHSIGPHAHEDDRIALQDLWKASGLGDAVKFVDGDYDCRQMKAMYQHMDYMCCTRFHSAIFSMAAGVPCLVVSYQGYKATGIMREMGLGDLVLPMGGLDAKSVIGVFNRLVERRQEIQDKLRRYKEACAPRLDELGRLLGETLRSCRREKTGGRLLFAIEQRFPTGRDGVYSYHLTYDRLWKRYVTVFDEVGILARAQRISEIPKGMGLATGPGVSFCALPDYQGPWQYLGVRRRVKAVVRAAVSECDAFLLRVPGNVATVVWKELRRRGVPFGVEVVADPWTAFAPGAFRTFLRPVFRRLYARNLALQCREATAAAYITDHVLQDLYPPGGWSIGVSDVYLDEEDFAGADLMEDRIRRCGAPRSHDRPWRLLHMGSMSQPYKGHEILLRSVAACVQGGLPIHLTLLGEGECQSQYEALAQDLGIGNCVEFLGTLPAGAPVRRLLEASDLFVFPSLTEGQGRSLIEAMARGLPSVASRVGGIVELLEPGDMVPPRDVAALTEKLREVLGDPQRLVSMATRNRREAEKYSNHALEPRRQEFYRELRERTLAWRSGNKR